MIPSNETQKMHGQDKSKCLIFVKTSKLFGFYCIFRCSFGYVARSFILYCHVCSNQCKFASILLFTTKHRVNICHFHVIPPHLML